MPDAEVSKTALTIIHFISVNILNLAFGKYFFLPLCSETSTCTSYKYIYFINSKMKFRTVNDLKSQL